jgi:hypothetical protein
LGYKPKKVHATHVTRCVDYVKDRAVGSNWVSERQFNKYLETIGFQRVRVRMMKVVRSYRPYILRFVGLEPEYVLYRSAGTSVFVGRRWLNPNDSPERQLLQEVCCALSWCRLKILFEPTIAATFLLLQGFHSLQQRFPRQLHCCEADFRYAIAAIQVCRNLGSAHAAESLKTCEQCPIF